MYNYTDYNVCHNLNWYDKKYIEMNEWKMKEKTVLMFLT